MTVSPFLPFVLAICWITPALITILFYKTDDASTPDADERMITSLRGVRADIVQLDFDAQARDWRDEKWKGPGARVRSQVTGTSQEIMVVAPYAEATVEVGGEGETVRRKCSLSLN